jgi:ribosomal protein S1
LDEEITGLIPSQEFGERRPFEVLAAGDKVKVAIVAIDIKDHKMLLTLQKSADADAESKKEEQKNS